MGDIYESSSGIPGKPNSVHLAELAQPSVRDTQTVEASLVSGPARWR
jgi:hypothetical protein